MALDANGISSTTTATDQQKFLVYKMISRNRTRIVAASVCDKMKMQEGSGLTAYFIRYQRMNVPVATLTEGVPPSYNALGTIQQVTVTMDQWGDVLLLTDVTQLTTYHPILDIAMQLLADNAQRVIDREVQLVWLANTNVSYGDGSVVTRRTITSGMTLSDAVIAQARVTMSDAGASPRGGPNGDEIEVANAASVSNSIRGGLHYLGVAGPHVITEIQKLGTNFGSWVSVSTYQDKKNLYNGEVGDWLGVRWVETNFIPKFTALGNSTEAVVDGAAFGTGTPTVTETATGGTLNKNATYSFKVTRKDLQRGFEEAISYTHTHATTNAGSNTYKLTFAFPSTAGYVYNIYFDTVQAGSGASAADTALKLVASNIAASASVEVTAIASTGTTAPDHNTSGKTIHPVYFIGEEACNWVGLQDLKTYVTTDQSTLSDVLNQLKGVGYKFMAKAMVRDTTRILRVEVCSTYV
jgi:N4-gp56 family major capsid protein